MPSATIALMPTTPENTSTEPMERSKPAATMTKVMPTAMTSRIDASVRMLRKLLVLWNAGSMIEKMRIRTSRTPDM